MPVDPTVSESKFVVPARTVPKLDENLARPAGGTMPAPPMPGANHDIHAPLGRAPTMLHPSSPHLQAAGSPPPSQVAESRRSFASTPEPRPSLTSTPQAVLPKLCPVCAIRYPAEFRVCPKDAAELVDAEADEDDLVGRTLAETYAITRIVGEGGMGRVYEARHVRIGGKRFAVKLLHPEYARMPEVLSRFQREAEAAASIESPHVGDVYDVGKTADGRPFIVAEFLEGKELADFFRARGKLDIQLAVRITRQICKALDAAHAKGIVHRDMKPENVFLVGDLQNPSVKVIDFGISKVAETGGPSLTKTGMIMGTPSYMAPEQAKGERVDHRVDVYATGAILYEAVTGRRPFDRADPTATIMAVLLEEPERPCALNPAVPPALEMVIQHAMAKAPDQRIQTMRELEAELAAFSDGATGASVFPPAMSPAGVAVQTSPRGVDARQRDVALSRPTIALLGALGAFGVVVGTLTVVAGVMRLARGGGAAANVTGSESLLMILFISLAFATPAAFAVSHIKKHIWSNSAKTVELAALIRRVVIAAFVAYGLVSLSVRFTEGLLLRRAAGVAWPVWDLVSGALAAAAAVGTYFLFADEKR
ncbi:MAG: serine/threonine-protein kinase [Polyangiaceae bacterium]